MTQKKLNFISGSAKEAPFCVGKGDLINVQLNVQQLVDIAAANPDKHRNGYVRLVLSRKRTPDEFSTHFFYEDEYQPDPSKAKKGGKKFTPSKKGKYIEPSAEEEEDDMPF